MGGIASIGSMAVEEYSLYYREWDGQGTLTESKVERALTHWRSRTISIE